MEKLFTVRELMAVLQVSQNTAYRLCNSGEIPSFKVGGNIRVRLSDLERYFGGEKHND